jgi:hypothetical protein
MEARACATLACPIQHAITGLGEAFEAPITAAAAASASVIAWGVRIATTPSTPGSSRHAATAAA